MNTIEKIYNIIIKMDPECRYDLFCSRSLIDDPVEVIYEENNITLQICYNYEYFEVLGLDDKQRKEFIKMINTYEDSLNN